MEERVGGWPSLDGYVEGGKTKEELVAQKEEKATCKDSDSKPKPTQESAEGEG